MIHQVIQLQVKLAWLVVLQADRLVGPLVGPLAVPLVAHPVVQELLDSPRLLSVAMRTW